MLSFGAAQEIYLCEEPVDMRRSFAGLTALIEAKFDLGALSRGAWFVFVSRLLASVLMLITLIMFFEGKLPRLRRSLMIYGVVAPLLIGLSQNNRWVVLTLYLPLFVAGQALMLATLRWTWQ